MQCVRTRAATATKRTRIPTGRPQWKRFAHDEAHGHGHSHGHHAEPVNESFGKGFFIALGAIPAVVALYNISLAKPGDERWFTKMIESYSDLQARWTERNDLHTRMIEQAGADRNLFIASKPSAYVDLKFPEVFNTGSPWNLSAGQSANLDKLIAHYEKKNYEANAAKVQALLDGTLKAEQEAPSRRDAIVKAVEIK